MPARPPDVRYRENSGKHLLTASISGFDPEQTFADPGNSRIARDMRRVDMETEREGSHDLRNSWLG
jgi:hypothetical protein